MSTGLSQTVTVKEQVINVDTVCSGQIRIANTGNAVRGPNVFGTNGFYLMSHPDNQDSVWVGNDGAGDVSITNGFPLVKTAPVHVAVGNLNELWFDADASGERICWIKA